MSSAQAAENKNPQKYQLFIDGQWVDAESGKTFTTPNPATGETLAEVAEADFRATSRGPKRVQLGIQSVTVPGDRGEALTTVDKDCRDARSRAAAWRTSGRWGGDRTADARADWVEDMPRAVADILDVDGRVVVVRHREGVETDIAD